MSDTYLTRSDLERWILDFASRSMDEHFVLSELDAASGDADHGSNMERGMSALLKSVRDWDKATAPREFFKDVGLHIVSSVGGVPLCFKSRGRYEFLQEYLVGPKRQG